MLCLCLLRCFGGLVGFTATGTFFSFADLCCLILEFVGWSLR